jgi:hypothetical protein
MNPPVEATWNCKEIYVTIRDLPDLDRAIYFDVEMRAIDPLDSPRIIGVLVDESYTAYACAPHLESSVAYQQSAHPEQNWVFANPAEVLEDHLEWAESENRHLVAYTNHEKKIFNALIPACRQRVAARYFDANMREWFQIHRGTTYRRLKREKAGQYNSTVGLKDFLRLGYIDYSVPDFFLRFSPADALRKLEDQLTRHGDHSGITGRRKADFTNLYTYNRHDCFGMRALLEYRASRE